MYWKIASLAIFAVFCGWTYIEVRIRASKEQKMEESFWERENEANNVRRKPIDHLDYIKVPENLPTHLLSDNIELPGILSTIEFLRKEKILNLTGYTNTELKLIKKILPEREYQIICLRFGLDNTPAYTQREVAKMLGISFGE